MRDETFRASSRSSKTESSPPQITGSHSLGGIVCGPMASAVRKPSRSERLIELPGTRSDRRKDRRAPRLIDSECSEVDSIVDPARPRAVHVHIAASYGKRIITSGVLTSAQCAPQQRLYFLPDLQGHGS